MPKRPRFHPCLNVAQVLILVVVAATAGCDLSHDPARTVTLEIEGSPSETDKDLIEEKVKSLIDEGSYVTKISSFETNSKWTVNVSPVSDVETFASQIDFGEVTDINGRTIKIIYSK